MQRNTAKRVSPTKEPPGIIFEFNTAAEADAFCNDGFDTERKSRLEGNAVLLRLPTQTPPSGED